MTKHHVHFLLQRLLLPLAILLLGAPSTAPAQVLPPGSTVEGNTVAEWTVEFWNWITSIDVSQDPGRDATGELAHTNNDGPVFFIAGTAGGDAMRRFTVPVDRPLLVPLLANLYPRTPEEVDVNDIPIWASGNPVDGERPPDPDFIRDFLRDAVSEATDDEDLDLVFDLDGIALTVEEALLHRESIVATIDITEPDNPISEPVGSWPLSYFDGFYVMLEPLARGEHTLRFGATVPAFGSSRTITNTLVAVPEPSAVWLLVIGLTAVVGMGIGPRALRRNGRHIQQHLSPFPKRSVQ